MLPADDWIVFVDDDNLLHPNLPAALAECVSETRADAVMMGMHYRPGEYFSATPANLVPCSCDGGQLAARIGFARAVPWSAGPTGDGIYLQSLYAHNPDRWVFLDRPLTYHNAQRWL